jgi:hypothetical protein
MRTGWSPMTGAVVAVVALAAPVVAWWWWVETSAAGESADKNRKSWETWMKTSFCLYMHAFVGSNKQTSLVVMTFGFVIEIPN